MSIPTWEEAAEDEFWSRVPQDLHEGQVRDYLGFYGDAIETRATGLRTAAENLLAQKFYGPSVVVSVVALEIMIQYFCVRPIIGGALSSNLLAEEVADHMFGARTYDQRKLLTALLKPWGVDLALILLGGGKPFWDTYQNIVLKKRNAFVHRGDEIEEGEAVLALDCCSTFKGDVVLKMADRLGFTIQRTGCWKRVEHGPQGMSISGGSYYSAGDPFK
jgi:hypothetical protein